MFYISSENRQRSQWLDTVSETAQALVESVNPNDLTFTNGFNQSWGNNWWEHYMMTVGKVELPNIRQGRVSLSRGQRKREITPVIPVFSTTAEFKVARSALYMTALQEESMARILEKKRFTLLPGVKIPKDDFFAAIHKDSETVSIEAVDNGVTQAPYAGVVCKDEAGKIHHQTFRLAPFIMLRVHKPSDNPALILLHECWHFDQHQYDPRPGFFNNTHEVDANMSVGDLVHAAIHSRGQRFRDAAWLKNSQSYLRWNAMRDIVGQEDVSNLSTATFDRLRAANLENPL